MTDEQDETAERSDRKATPAKPTRGQIREERQRKQTRAAQLRVAGYSYAEIARTLGYANESGAWKAAEAARKGALREAGSQLLDLEITRLDSLQRASMTRALGGDPASIRVALRVMEQRAKLLGLYEARGEERIADTRQALAVFAGQMAAKYPDPDPMPDDETDDDQGAA